MKALNFNNEKFEADKIIKTETDIVGYDSKGTEVFAFRGISDFTKFELEEGQTFDVEQNAEETISKEVANLKISDMKKDTIITSALQTIASLKVEIMGLKGGNA